jgi:electron transfer flavoprotein beta subunit
VNIAVCIKQVPDTETRIKLSEDRSRVVEDDINFIMNPYDEFAVEEALKLQEKNGGEVTYISLGPDRVSSALRSALAMGGDKAIHIKTDKVPEDPQVTAQALTAVLKETSYDLVLLGKQAIDDDHAQMPSLLAEKLGWPAVTVVVKLDVENGRVKAEREIDGAHEIVESSLPALIGTQRGLNEPRYASLKGIMRAKKIQIEERTLTLQPSSLSVAGFEFPPAKQAGKIVGKDASAVPELLRLLHEEAKVI